MHRGISPSGNELLAILLKQTPDASHVGVTGDAVVEADVNLVGISRGDLVLVDSNQQDLAREGIHLLDLPGIVLRGHQVRRG